MDVGSGATQEVQVAEARNFYSVWGFPPEDVTARLNKLMEALRSEFGGPAFEPHVTVVRAISLTEGEAREKFSKACEGLKVYNAAVDKVETDFLLLHPTPEVMNASAHSCSHFGYERSSPYMSHLSLLYLDSTDQERKKVEEKAYSLDESIGSLSFPISRLALYKTDPEDKSLKSWEKVTECSLEAN